MITESLVDEVVWFVVLVSEIAPVPHSCAIDSCLSYVVSCVLVSARCSPRNVVYVILRLEGVETVLDYWGLEIQFLTCSYINN